MIEATLCYIKKENQYLMMHRTKKHNDYHEGKWNAIGGKLEKGESPLDCILREVKEETGLTIYDPIFMGHISFPGFDGENDWSVFVFKAQDFEGDLIDCPEGELHWIDEDTILDLNLWEGDPIFIPYVLKNKKFLSKFIYENKKLKAHWIQEI